MCVHLKLFLCYWRFIKILKISWFFKLFLLFYYGKYLHFQRSSEVGTICFTYMYRETNTPSTLHSHSRLNHQNFQLVGILTKLQEKTIYTLRCDDKWIEVISSLRFGSYGFLHHKPFELVSKLEKNKWINN